MRCGCMPPPPRPHLLRAQATDITESEEAYTLKADVPGMSKGDVSIRITPDRVMTVGAGARAGGKAEASLWGWGSSGVPSAPDTDA